MQTVIQVIATGTGSLRNKIMSDSQLEKKFGFIKVWHKQPGRPHGWAKIHSARDVHGAINLEWHARTAYEDHPDPERHRDLLRLWLTLRAPLELPEDFRAGGITSREVAFR